MADVQVSQVLANVLHTLTRAQQRGLPKRHLGLVNLAVHCLISEVVKKEFNIYILELMMKVL